TRRLLDWLAKHASGAVRRLEDVARQELAEAPRPSDRMAIETSILGPWRDWLDQLARTDSTVHARVTDVIGPGPVQAKIQLADRIPIRFVLPDKGTVEPADTWPGPDLFGDRRSGVVYLNAGAAASAESG